MIQRKWPRRIVAVVLMLGIVLSMSACSKYRVEMSNKEQTAHMLTVGEEKVAFEVIDFFYHTRKEAYPNDDFATLMARVENDVCELYGIFAACRQMNIDPYGETVNESLDESVKTMIDEFPTRRDYIDRITSMHMTDTVCRLLLRSALCEQMLLSMLNPTDEELRAFCEQDAVIRVKTMQLYFDVTMTDWAEGRMNEILAKLENGEDFITVARKLASADSEHTYITVGQWNRLCGTLDEIPAMGTLSEPLYELDSVLLMCVAPKDVDEAMENRAALLDSYMEYQIEQQTAALKTGMQKTDAYLALTEASFAS